MWMVRWYNLGRADSREMYLVLADLLVIMDGVPCMQKYLLPPDSKQIAVKQPIFPREDFMNTRKPSHERKVTDAVSTHATGPASITCNAAQPCLPALACNIPDASSKHPAESASSKSHLARLAAKYGNYTAAEA